MEDEVRNQGNATGDEAQCSAAAPCRSLSIPRSQAGITCYHVPSSRYIPGVEPMSYEIGQLDIPDRQLLPARARPRGSMSTEIGEAIVTHTIFGRARVRIIRKHDGVRRTLWRTVAAVLAAVAAAAWLEWIASQQAGTIQGAESALPMSASVQDAPLVQPESIPMPAIALPAANEPAPPSAGIGNPEIVRQAAPQAAQGRDAAAPIPAKPARRPKPSTASTPPDTNNTASMKQTGRPRLSGQSSAKQTAPAAAMSDAAQPAEDGAGAVAPLAAPVVQEDATTRSSGDDGPAADPADAQP